MAGDALTLAVIIPALDEERVLPALLASLAALRVDHEVLVVDGGSEDATRAVAESAGARVLRAPRGRGIQLAAGAAATRTPWLFFVHADARLPRETAGAIDAIVRARVRDAACVFRLRIEGRRWAYRLIERLVALRTRRLGLPYGDQGLLITRDVYTAVGGYPGVPLMEDVALARALRRVCRPRLLPQAILVSDRRWRREGVLRATGRNWWLLARYLLGAPPERLLPHYTPSNGQPSDR